MVIQNGKINKYIVLFIQKLNKKEDDFTNNENLIDNSKNMTDFLGHL